MATHNTGHKSEPSASSSGNDDRASDAARWRSNLAPASLLSAFAHHGNSSRLYFDQQHQSNYWSSEQPFPTEGSEYLHEQVLSSRNQRSGSSSRSKEESRKQLKSILEEAIRLLDMEQW